MLRNQTATWFQLTKVRLNSLTRQTRGGTLVQSEFRHEEFREIREVPSRPSFMTWAKTAHITAARAVRYHTPDEDQAGCVDRCHAFARRARIARSGEAAGTSAGGPRQYAPADRARSG